MKFRKQCCLPVVAVVACFATAAIGGTWRVELDGSGDFSVIQDAVDASASGDTIRIGPGRYNDQHLYTCPGWSDSVRVLIPQHELTVIGSGPTTIIGQVEPYDLEQGNHKGIVAGDYMGNSVIRIEKLHFENMNVGVYTSYEGSGGNEVLVRSCTFSDNRLSVLLIGDGGDAEISDCHFDGLPRNGSHLVGSGQRVLRVSNCTFRLLDYHQWGQGHLGLMWVSQAIIEDCEFIEGRRVTNNISGGSTTFERCLFSGQSLYAIALGTGGVSVGVNQCVFRDQNVAAIVSERDAVLAMRHTAIENVSSCSVTASYAGFIDVKSCDLAAGELGVVHVYDITNCYDVRHLDFTGNYWGTDDPDSIQALIRDHHDSEDACYIIDYEPFSTSSTPVEKKSLSELRDLFR